MQKVCYINKPKGMTSFDVCYKMRKVLNTKAIGHTGTLDPNATGVMIILFDKTCKASNFLMSDTKEYLAEVSFGFLTDTLDVDGRTIKEDYNYILPDKKEFVEVLKSFLGKSLQKPPMTSAIKIKGKKLYEYQRAKQEVELPLRPIEVFDIELLSLDHQRMVFKARVSSGTYIRSLVNDIMEKLGLLGTLSNLTRTKIDNVDLAMCDELAAAMSGQIHYHKLIELIKAHFVTIECGDEMVMDIKNGKRIKLNSDASKVAMVQGDLVLAIYELADDGQYRCVRGLF